jgi:hypothetical protein
MSHEFWMDAIAITAFLLNSWFMVGIARLNKVNEVHHGYLGLALVMLALVVDSVIMVSVGAVLLLDDAWQHYRQSTVPDYLSPLHNLYVKIATKWPWIAKITAWLDKVFGSVA